jgi:molybdopterin molybdotransferase
MMDGYAVFYDDIKNSTPETPVILPLLAENYIGRVTHELKPKTAIKVPTGGMVPDMADVVIKVEDIELLVDENNQKSIKILSVPEKGKNISFAGEDFKKGETVIKAGTRLSFTDIGAILSVGVFSIYCYQRPKIAIFPTGDELVDSNTKLEPGKVYDSTTYIINEITTLLGFELKRFPLVRDERRLIVDRINSLVTDFDIILMTGGTSVGNKDYIPIIIDEMGSLHVHGTSVRPGSPITAGIVRNSIVIGLPGFPVSTISSFLFFVLPLIFYMLGDYQFKYPKVKAKLTMDMKSKKGRKDFMRVNIKDDGKGNFIAEPIMIAGSSLLKTINKANGIIIVDEDVEIVHKDQELDVIPFIWLGKF